MQTIKKYLLLIFLIENIAVQTFLLGGYAQPIFYFTLALGFIGIIDMSIFRIINFKKFKWLYLLGLLYLGYTFLIAPEYVNPKNLQYLIAKIMTFIIIITSLSSNYNFYTNRGLFWVMMIIGFFLLYGLLEGNNMYDDGRGMAGFTNPNTTGSMGAILIGILIFYLKNRKWNVFFYFLLFLGLYGVILGGSRSGFLLLGLFIILRYGISFKTLLMTGIILFTGFYLLDHLGIHAIGMQRVIDTYTGEIGTNRENEVEAARIMIATKPYTGWGFDFENVGAAESVSELGPHNGYLELTEQIGIPLTIIYFLIVLFPLLSNLLIYLKRKIPVSLFPSISISIMVAANYESLFIGVHEFETNLFFFALAMVSAQNYFFKLKSTYNDRNYIQYNQA